MSHPYELFSKPNRSLYDLVLTKRKLRANLRCIGCGQGNPHNFIAVVYSVISINTLDIVVRCKDCGTPGLVYCDGQSSKDFIVLTTQLPFL